MKCLTSEPCGEPVKLVPSTTMYVSDMIHGARDTRVNQSQRTASTPRMRHAASDGGTRPGRVCVLRPATQTAKKTRELSAKSDSKLTNA